MKKFLAVILASVNFVSGASFAYGDEVSNLTLEGDNTTTEETVNEYTNNEEIQRLLGIINAKIDIPKDFIFSDCGVLSSGISKDNIRVFKNFTFSKQNSESYITVKIDNENNIASYNYYEEESNNKDVQEKSEDECLKVAEVFLQKVIPEYYSEFKCIEKDKSYSDYYFTFKQFKGNIPVDFSAINIYVNPISLKVNGYRFENVNYLDDLNNISTDNIISEQQAVDAYLNKGLIKPTYTKVTRNNYDDKKTGKVEKEFAVYETKLLNDYIVDASNGKIVVADDNYNEISQITQLLGNQDLYNIMLQFVSARAQAETEEIQKIANIISKEEADAEVKKIYGETVSFGKIKMATIDGYEKNYTWNIFYENGYARIDAKDKTIKNFIYFTENLKDIFDFKDFTDEEFNAKKAKADEIIQKIMPQNIDKLSVVQDSNFLKGKIPSVIGYERKENGIIYDNNLLLFAFDDNDELSFLYYDFENKENNFKINNMISPEKAFEIIRESEGFSLKYKLISEKGKERIILSYTLDEPYFSKFGFSAETGEKIDLYTGEKYVEEIIPKNYPDIKGHWCEKYVNDLLDKNIYFKREMFLPNEYTTKKDFAQYNENSGILFYKEKKEFENSSDFITRKEMCDIIIKYLGYSDIVDLDIYKNNFKDVPKEYIGKVALVAGLKILTADENGNLNLDEYVTNAQVAKIVYMLKNME